MDEERVAALEAVRKTAKEQTSGERQRTSEQTPEFTESLFEIASQEPGHQVPDSAERLRRINASVQLKVSRVQDHWQPSDGLQVFIPGNWETEITTEGQGHLDELASDGKTTPRAPLTRNSTFRIKCGDDGFHHVSFDISHHSSTGDLHRARSEVPRVSYTGDNFTSMSSLLNKFLFGEMPNSNSFYEFSERLQIVLFTLRDFELNAVYNTTADV